MKRTTFILTLLLSAATMMAEEFTIGLFTYQTTSSNEVEIVDADNRIINVCLNPIITYQGVTYNVTSIGESAFSLCRSLTSITIPNSVKSIGNNAFSGCISLNSINIPNSVTSIGYWAFKGTALHNNRTNWENGALYINNCLIAVDASLVGDYKIKENTRLIGSRAFYGCSSLNAVTIPNSVKGIGDWAFAGCTALSSITIPKSVTSIGERAFEGCIYLTTLTIPNSVKSIEKYAFYDCKSLTSVTISESVTSIDNGAFYNCSSLTSITIPNSVKSIGEYAFYGCSSLNSVAIPESVTSIGTSAFEYCSSLTSITIPKSVKSIGSSAFSGCSVLVSIHWIIQSTDSASIRPFRKMANQITSLTFGDNVQYIPASFCEGMTKLNSVTIPNSVKSIGDRAFAGCSRLTSITIPNNVTSFGGWAFKDCESLTSVTWNVKSCNDFSYHTYLYGPFYEIRSQITSFTFGDSVQHIPRRLCTEMTKLTSITIPNSVTSIGQAAFFGCSSLTSITIPNSVTEIGEGAFYGTALYNNKSNWKNGALYINDCLVAVSDDIVGDFNIKEGTRIIADDACWRCSNLTSITIPNSVTSIGLGAFNCTTLYNNKSNWKNGAFYIDDCLIKVDYDVKGDFSIKPGTRAIANYAFAERSGITSITIPNSVKSIGKGAFYGCSSLTSLNIPNSVTSIGKGVFYKCSSLDSITIPADISMTDNYADSIDLPVLPPPPPPPAVQEVEVLNVVEDDVETESIEINTEDDKDVEVVIAPPVEAPVEEEEEEVIFMVVETMPEFPGGAQAMMRFIGENIKYPTYAQEKGIQGRVICQFVVEKDGKVTDIHVVRSSGDASLDKEAIRVINSMPKWKPGKQRGKPVRVKYTIPVNFRLQ